MDRDKRTTWSLTDLKLNFWRGIHDRQKATEATETLLAEGKMSEKSILRKAIKNYAAAFGLVVAGMGVFVFAAYVLTPTALIKDWSASHEAWRNLGLLGAATLAATAAIVGLFYAKERTETEKSQHQLDIKREQNQRYLEAIKLLATNDDAHRAERMGALYALATLAEEGTDDQKAGAYYVQVVDTLAAFVRDRAPATDGNAPPPCPDDASDEQIRAWGGSIHALAPPLNDIRTAMGLISRLNPDGRFYGLTEGQQIDLRATCLNRLELIGAQLAHCSLSQSHMAGCELMVADLSHATLWNANLSHTILIDANLSHATLWNANLANAGLWDTKLSNVLLSAAKNLTQKQVDEIIYEKGKEPTLPEGLTLNPDKARDPAS